MGALGPLDVLNGIALEDESIADCLDKAEVLDALGKDEDAVTTYTRLLDFDIEDDLRNRVLLRIALLKEKKKENKKKKKDDEEPTPLAAFAREEGRDPALRNQAAIVLALLDEQKDAIELFAPSGTGSKRYRQEVRLAEWAIERSRSSTDCVRTGGRSPTRRFTLEWRQCDGHCVSNGSEILPP